jgi:hypothetical protein
MTYVIAQDPITRAAKQYKEKTTTKLTTTTKDTEFVDYPVNNKSNHNKRCLERQKVWSLDPIQAII